MFQMKNIGQIAIMAGKNQNCVSDLKNSVQETKKYSLFVPIN